MDVGWTFLKLINWLEFNGTELESTATTAFNPLFIKAFKTTRAFLEWDQNTDEAIFDLVEPKCVPSLSHSYPPLRY